MRVVFEANFDLRFEFSNLNYPGTCVHVVSNSRLGGLWGHDGLQMTSEVSSSAEYPFRTIFGKSSGIPTSPSPSDWLFIIHWRALHARKNNRTIGLSSFWKFGFFWLDLEFLFTSVPTQESARNGMKCPLFGTKTSKLFPIFYQKLGPLKRESSSCMIDLHSRWASW